MDDNSSDNSVQIIQDAMDTYPWISCFSVNDGNKRERGRQIAKLFNMGLSKIDDEWEFCSKIDADMILPIDYFERILKNFSETESLGIASGSCFVVSSNGKKVDEFSFGNHTRGGLKTYSRGCLNGIGGVKEVDGWDGVDNILAEKEGWDCRNFSDIRVEHRRKTGSYDGILMGCLDSGRFAYSMRYYPPFLFARAFHRMLRRPFFLGGMAMIIGYFYAIFSRKTASMDRESIVFLRSPSRIFLVLSVE